MSTLSFGTKGGHFGVSFLGKRFAGGFQSRPDLLLLPGLRLLKPSVTEKCPVVECPCHVTELDSPCVSQIDASRLVAGNVLLALGAQCMFSAVYPIVRGQLFLCRPLAN